ncbi:MAG: Uma2 family endonuclease [Acidobacteriota bacterium]
MSAEPQGRLGVEEYLALERGSETRHEYLDGEIFAMSGASREHNLIGTNIVGTLHPQLKRPGCEKYANDMRVRIPATGLYAYPDVVVACEEPRFEDDERDTLLNPTLIFEILSPSTEDYDRGRKFVHCRSLPSLQVYLLVAQDRIHVEVFTRQQDDRWVLWETDDLNATLELPAISATLAVADIYDRVPGIK